MTPLVLSIVEVLMNKIALGISNRGNDWTAASAVIASNGSARFAYRKKPDRLACTNKRVRIQDLLYIFSDFILVYLSVVSLIYIESNCCR